MYFLHANFFLCKIIFNKMVYFDYKYIINKLSKSLIKRACQRLLHHSEDPISLESISEKSKQIESYLKHILEVYENLLNKKYRHKNYPEFCTLANINLKISDLNSDP